MRVLTVLGIFLSVALAPAGSLAAAQNSAWMPAAVEELEARLVDQYGEPQRVRIDRSLSQVADFWRSDDRDEAAFVDFVQTNLAGARHPLLGSARQLSCHATR